MLLLISASLAALLHVGFFVIESVLFTKPAGRKVFGTSAADAETMKFLAFNQGFYNLFLAIGCFAGVFLVTTGRHEVGRALIAFACATMVGAAAVLASGGMRYKAGFLAQGVPPLVALVALALG